MTALRLRIRREAMVTGTVGRGVEVDYRWIVQMGTRGAPSPIIAHFPTFEQARRYAAEWVDHNTTTEPPC